MQREQWNEHYAERDPPATAAAHARLEPEVASLAPGRALDLACGFGHNAVWLARQGWTVTAVDFSEVALEGARELARSCSVEVDWVAADLLDYVPERAAFDLVLLFFLHVPPAERDKVIARAGAAVAPGGTFLLAAHDRLNHAEGYRGPKDPTVLYSAEDVVPLLAGFEIERAERIRRPIETPEGERLMVDALVRARRNPPGR